MTLKAGLKLSRNSVLLAGSMKTGAWKLKPLLDVIVEGECKKYPAVCCQIDALGVGSLYLNALPHPSDAIAHSESRSTQVL